MWPFFTYFGGKWRIAPKYPPPTHEVVIEPFAGSAGYSVRHYAKSVRLYDVDETICGVWDYLIHAKPEEIMSLPLAVSHVSELAVCQEAKWLIGYWLNKGTTHPCNVPSRWMRDGIRPNSHWGAAVRQRLADQAPLISHWTIERKSYLEIECDEPACWFVDPPYQVSGARYKHDDIDYETLASWCRTRNGQVIVCEQGGAQWLPFVAHCDAKALEGKHGKKKSIEVIWTNETEADAAAA